MVRQREHPVPSVSAARDAADRIVESRTANRDPDLEKLDDDFDGVVAHVARHGDPPADLLRRLVEGVPDDVVRGNVLDALLVLDLLDAQHAKRAAQLDAWRLGVILAGQRVGMGPTDLMGPLHQANRQGVAELVGRLRGRVHGIARTLGRRAGPAAPAPVSAPPAPPRIDQTAALVAFARGLLARRAMIPRMWQPTGDAVGLVDPVDLHDLLDDLEDRVPGGLYSSSTTGLVGILSTLVRYLTRIPGLNDELAAVIAHGGESLPPRIEAEPTSAA